MSFQDTLVITIVPISNLINFDIQNPFKSDGIQFVGVEIIFGPASIN